MGGVVRRPTRGLVRAAWSLEMSELSYITAAAVVDFVFARFRLPELLFSVE